VKVGVALCVASFGVGIILTDGGADAAVGWLCGVVFAVGYRIALADRPEPSS
jgi:hypothetical protein